MAEPYVKGISNQTRPRLRSGLSVLPEAGETIIISPRLASMETIEDPDGVWAALLAITLVVSWALHYVVEDKMAPLWRRLGADTVGRAARWLENAVPLGKSTARAQSKSGTIGRQT